LSKKFSESGIRATCERAVTPVDINWVVTSRKERNVNAKHAKPIAAIAGSGAVVAAALFAMVLQGSPDSGSMAGDMSTGVTITATTPGTAVPQAVPGIRGPAPLPPEEQGLPG
jgi:hypothetical protein